MNYYDLICWVRSKVMLKTPEPCHLPSVWYNKDTWTTSFDVLLVQQRHQTQFDVHLDSLLLTLETFTWHNFSQLWTRIWLLPWNPWMSQIKILRNAGIHSMFTLAEVFLFVINRARSACAFVTIFCVRTLSTKATYSFCQTLIYI